MRRRTLVLLLIALAALVEAVVAAAIFMGDDGGTAATALPQHPVAGTFEPNALRIEDCSEQACFEQAFGNVAYRRGPRVAMPLFDAKYGDGSDPGCHRVAHIIGAASLAHFQGNVALTFAQGSASCNSGYYHGVLERSLLQVKSYDPNALGDVARSLCADERIREITWLAYSCLHGLGHGLMITTGYDLPLSLQVCKRLAADWDRQSCNGGVFMENMSSSYGFQSRWLKEDDLVYPCDWVASEVKLTCYQLITSRILNANGVDWEETAQICAEVEEGWVEACFQSYGRDVSGQTHRDPAEINRLCGVARPYGGERSCLLFAAMDVTSNFSGGKQASVLCSTARPEYRDPCYHAVGQIMGRFTATDAARVADCRAISTRARDVEWCIRGATGKEPAVFTASR